MKRKWKKLVRKRYKKIVGSRGNEMEEIRVKKKVEVSRGKDTERNS